MKEYVLLDDPSFQDMANEVGYKNRQFRGTCGTKETAISLGLPATCFAVGSWVSERDVRITTNGLIRLLMNVPIVTELALFYVYLLILFPLIFA